MLYYKLSGNLLSEKLLYLIYCRPALFKKSLCKCAYFCLFSGRVAGRSRLQPAYKLV